MKFQLQLKSQPTTTYHTIHDASRNKSTDKNLDRYKNRDAPTAQGESVYLSRQSPLLHKTVSHTAFYLLCFVGSSRGGLLLRFAAHPAALSERSILVIRCLRTVPR